MHLSLYFLLTPDFSVCKSVHVSQLKTVSLGDQRQQGFFFCILRFFQSGQPTPTTPITPPPPHPHLFLLHSPPLPNYSPVFPSSPSRLIHSASSSLFSQVFFGLHPGGGRGSDSGGSRPVRSEAWVGCVCSILVRLSLHCLPLLALSLPSLISMLIRKVTNQYIQWSGLAIDTISIHLPLAAPPLNTHTVTRKQLPD